MFGISYDHILIIGVVLLLFGPKRLPDLGRSVGQSIKNFKDSFNGVGEEKIEKIAQQKPAEDHDPKQNS